MCTCDQQGAHGADVEADFQLAGTRAVARGFSALDQAAVHKHGVTSGQRQSVARPGNAVYGSVVGDLKLL